MTAFDELMTQDQPGEVFWAQMKTQTAALRKPLLDALNTLHQVADFPTLDAYLTLREELEANSIAFAYDQGYAAGQRDLMTAIIDRAQDADREKLTATLAQLLAK